MPSKLRIALVAALAVVAVTGSDAFADPPLKSALGLNVEQARQVDQIESRYRKPYSAKRQERNTELRKLRRARLANDAPAIAKHEAASERMHQELRQIYLSRNDEIRRVLTGEQQARFEAYLQDMKEMKGSSRDVKDF